MVNWAEVGALAGVAAVIETPTIIIVTVGYRWVKSVNYRLARIEERSHRRRRDDSYPYRDDH